MQKLRDPWAGLTTEQVLGLLSDRSWPVREVGGNCVADLGDRLVAVSVDGIVGEANLAKLTGLHGVLPEAPKWQSAPGVSTRLFWAPKGAPVPNAANLHGAVAGVSVLGTGTIPIPPSVSDSTFLRWAKSSHPATIECPALPAWLADLARDPIAAKRAWSTARPTGEEARLLADWERTLIRSRGKIVKSFGNVMKIFRAAPPFCGAFRLNRMTQGIEFEGEALPEARVGAFREQIEDASWGGFDPSEAGVMAAIRTIAHDKAYHPVQDYLDRLEWDGVARLDRVSEEILRAQGDDHERSLARRMVRCWFISAVARALKPGEQVDTSLVLAGPQGFRKSSFFRAMAGAWFADTEIRIGDKDGLQQIHAAWITEWGEIDRITSARHAGEVKAFVARRADTFRPPYGRITETFQRSCVIVGSTNSEQFLTDPTGSRRFWVVRVGARIDLEAAAAIRDQLWAEAVHAYRSGEQWWLTDDEDRQREEGAERHRLRDPWEAVIERYLASRYREDCATEPGRKILTTSVLLERAIEVPPKDRSKAHEMRVAEVMRSLGYRTEQHALTKAEAELLKRPDGSAPRKVNQWVRDEVAEVAVVEAIDDETMPDVPF